MSDTGPLRAFLVDPSLFTAPYDAALTGGLVAAGVEPLWAVRPSRRTDQEAIPSRYAAPFFYRNVDDNELLQGGLRKLVKGAAHAVGLLELMRRVLRSRPTVVHFQWCLVPALDAVAMRWIRRRCPVVMTVHDTVPFNGDRLSLLQRFRFDAPMHASDRVVVHTRAGRDRLVERGIPEEKVVVIPHGPLALAQRPASPPSNGDPYTIVMFGEIKGYKGPDVLVDAVALLPEDVRRRARIVIAGRPRMDLAPLTDAIRSRGLDETIQLVPRRLTEEEMGELFAQAHCFVFPYRQIDASGVYFLTKSLGRWIIASRVGVFAEDVRDGEQGALVKPGDACDLARELERAIVTRPRAEQITVQTAWSEIGLATRALYRSARQAWAQTVPSRAAAQWQDVPDA